MTATPIHQGLCDDRPLPWVVRARDRATPETLLGWIAAHRGELTARLQAVGAVLFAGFGLSHEHDLQRVVQACGARRQLRYVGGDSPRTQVAGDVYTSTECPPSVRIPLHNELSYASRYPRRLFFLCVQPPASGGETTLADGRAVYDALAPAVRARFAARGVRYTAIYRAESAVAEPLLRLLSKSWPEVFETNDRRVAEERCRALHMRFRWLGSGALHTSTIRPALAGRGDERPSWFNQAHLFRFSPGWMGRFQYLMASLIHFGRDGRGRHAQYGDGGEIEPEALEHIHAVLERHTVARPWQRGDLLMVDNLRCMHGRNAFSGRRRVLVTMTG